MHSKSIFRINYNFLPYSDKEVETCYCIQITKLLGDGTHKESIFGDVINFSLIILDYIVTFGQIFFLYQFLCLRQSRVSG